MLVFVYRSATRRKHGVSLGSTFTHVFDLIVMIDV